MWWCQFNDWLNLKLATVPYAVSEWSLERLWVLSFQPNIAELLKQGQNIQKVSGKSENCQISEMQAIPGIRDENQNLCQNFLEFVHSSREPLFPEIVENAVSFAKCGKCSSIYL